METRKKNRLNGWDYSRGGMYFITICTEGKRRILSEIVGATSGRQANVNLSKFYFFNIKMQRRFLGVFILKKNHIYGKL